MKSCLFDEGGRWEDEKKRVLECWMKVLRRDGRTERLDDHTAVIRLVRLSHTVGSQWSIWSTAAPPRLLKPPSSAHKLQRPGPFCSEGWTAGGFRSPSESLSLCIYVVVAFEFWLAEQMVQVLQAEHKHVVTCSSLFGFSNKTDVLLHVASSCLVQK